MLLHNPFFVCIALLPEEMHWMPRLLLKEFSLGMKFLLVIQKPDRERSVPEDQEVLKLRMNRIFKPL